MYIVKKEIGVYTFDELPEDLQDQVLERDRDYYVEIGDWWDCVFSEWKDRLDQMGFENADIRFSGFWSQGDGASFTAYCDDQKILNTLFMCNERNIGDLKRWRLWFEMVENGPYFRFDIRRIDNRYVHANSVVGEVEEDMSCFTHKIYEAFNNKGQKYYTSVFDEKLNIEFLGEMFNDFVRDICREIYSSLEKEYEWLTSKEFLKEMFMELDREFNVDMETMELI